MKKSEKLLEIISKYFLRNFQKCLKWKSSEFSSSMVCSVWHVTTLAVAVKTAKSCSSRDLISSSLLLIMRRSTLATEWRLTLIRALSCSALTNYSFRSPLSILFDAALLLRYLGDDFLLFRVIFVFSTFHCFFLYSCRSCYKCMLHCCVSCSLCRLYYGLVIIVAL